MRYKLPYLIGIMTTAALVALALQHRVATAPKIDSAVIAASENDTEIAALGRVEPQSEEIRVGAEISGKIARLFVREGDRVVRGQVLAVLENSDLHARLTSAEARIQEKEAELRRIVNGARQEERKEARASVDEAYAVLENTRSEAERREGLFARGIITREEAERIRRELQVATARHEAARERLELLDSGPREEDRAK